MSYTKAGFSSLSLAIGSADKEVDIQTELGKIGQETHKFECYLYTPEYDKYKYRVFFVKYDTSNYPVNIILEESVARSISSGGSGYVLSCAAREELEELIYKNQFRIDDFHYSVSNIVYFPYPFNWII